MPAEPSTIPNVLASRYASQALKQIWSLKGRVRLEREYWISVMRAQRSLGLAIPEEALSSYERVIDKIDLDSIRERERLTRHDVKARIEEFNALAGHEHIHKGLTSRDLTEAIDQLQLYRSLKVIRLKAVAALLSLGAKAQQYRSQIIAARTHNVAAQATTFGKRLAMFGEDFQHALQRLDTFMEAYPARGVKGAVGTQVDLLTLFEGDRQKTLALEERIGSELGLPRTLGAVGQVYPRSLDLECVSTLYQLASGPSSFAKTLRLMAGHELASEGFAPGQVGSSAMPHKMNARSCERLNGLHTLLKGYLTMAAELSGDQWNEGDVSCSVVRRVVLPDAFFAIDGLLETFLTILKQMEIFPALMERENARYLPFLATTTLMMEAVRAGLGREEAHSLIKQHALAAAQALRTGESQENDLIARIAADERFPLTAAQLKESVHRQKALIGLAEEQTDAFLTAVETWKERFAEAAELEPEPLL